MSRDLLFVALSMLVWGFGETSFFSFQPLYLQQLGAVPLQIGLLLGANGVANAIAHIPAGYLADRFGRRTLMWAAWFIGVLSTAIMALANNLPFFIVGMLLYSTTMFVVAPLNSYVTAARGRWSVGRALTIMSAAYSTGAIFGPLVGGWIGEHYGYRSIFAVATGIFILSTSLILFIQPQPIETVSPDTKPGREIFKNKVYVLFLVVLFTATLAMFLPQPLTPNFLQQVRNLSLSEIGTLYAVAGAGIVLINLILGQLNAYAGFIYGQLAVSGFAATILIGGGVPLYSIGFLLLGGYRAARSMANAHIQSLVPASTMGLAYGVSETIGSTATVLAPVLAGAIYNAQPKAVYLYSLGLLGVSILASLLFKMKASRRASLWKPVA